MQTNREAARTPLVRMRAALRLQYYIMNALKANTLAGRKMVNETSLKRDHESISPSPQAAAVAVAIATAAHHYQHHHHQQPKEEKARYTKRAALRVARATGRQRMRTARNQTSPSEESDLARVKESERTSKSTNSDSYISTSRNRTCCFVKQ